MNMVTNFILMVTNFNLDLKIAFFVYNFPTDEGLTPTKDGGTCLRRLSMFRKEVD